MQPSLSKKIPGLVIFIYVLHELEWLYVCSVEAAVVKLLGHPQNIWMSIILYGSAANLYFAIANNQWRIPHIRDDRRSFLALETKPANNFYIRLGKKFRRKFMRTPYPEYKIATPDSDIFRKDNVVFS